MSEKREEKKKGIRKHWEFVLEKLHEGIRPADYRGEKEAIPHTTLNEILQILEKTGTAFLDKGTGKWYYFWKKEKEELLKDYQEFKTIDEYNTKLNHSKNLVKQAIDEEESNEFNIDLYRSRNSYNFSFFLRHLETGYSDIYRLYEKVKKNNSEMEFFFSALLQKMKEISLERGVELSKHPEKFKDLEKEIDKMPKNIFYSLKEYLNYFFDKDRKIGYQNAAMQVSFPVYSKEDRKEFIEDCSHSEDIKKLHNELVVISKKQKKIMYELNIKIKSVIIKILEDGEPLRGICDRCPKVTIGRSS